jgi:integral membrane protein (TIGR03766 family)
MVRERLLKAGAYITYGYMTVMFLMVLFFNEPFVFVFSVPIQVICFSLGIALFIWLMFAFRTQIASLSFLRRFGKGRRRRIIGGLFILFVIQLLFIAHFYSPTAHDPAYIYSIAQSTFEQNAQLTYFSTYPNNFLLLFFEHGLHIFNEWLGLGIELYLMLVLLNIVLIDVSIYLVYVITARIFSPAVASYAFILSILLFGLTPWLTGVYSDTLSLPMTLLIFYVYLQWQDARLLKRQLLYALLLGMLTYCGFLLKPSTIFSGIAIILVEVMVVRYQVFIRQPKKLVALGLSMVVLVCGMFAVRLPYHYMLTHQQIVPYDASKNLPFTHWLMLGLNEGAFNGNKTYGMWAQDDFETSNEPNGKAAKMQANIAVIKERLQAYGVIGFLGHLWHKSIWILGDGTFSWGHDGVLHPVREAQDEGLTKMVQSFVYPQGETHSYYAYILQTIWFIIFFNLALGLFCIKKYANKEFFMIACTIFGSIVFILLFEGRARYLINNLGFYIIAASLGLTQLLDSLERFRRKQRAK